MTKNINYVSHKKSKLKTNDGKPQLPSASALVEGEIAINYAEDVETLSIKNESGDVVTFSSDNYYTEQKLGSAFTNNDVTVTNVTNKISDVANAAAVGVLSLKESKTDLSAFTEHTASTVHMTETEKTNLDSLATNIVAISGITADNIEAWNAAAGIDLTQYYKKVETSGKTELETAFSAKADDSDLTTLSGTVTAHTANADIHVTSADKTAWNAKADLSDIPSVSGYADAVKYNNTTHYVEFYHGTTAGTKVFEYDASPFIIDGMVQNVEIKDVTSGETQVTCLVISFNTDAGKQDINIPISQIFDASNYYTTAQTDTKITEATSGKVDNATYTAYTADTATEICNKLAISDFNTYSGAVDTLIGEKASQTSVDALNNTVTAHTANTDIHVTAADKTKWNNKSDFSGSYNDLTDKPTIPSKTSDLVNDSDFATSAYVQTVTSDMATETWVIEQGYLTSADISGKQDVSGMTAYTTTATTNELSGTVTAHTANTEIHVTTEDKSKWNNVDNKLNTSDFNTYSGTVDTAISNKVDKVEGKGLSTNDFTNELKTKLDGIAEGAEVNVQANWTEDDTTSDSYIQNKPTLGTAAAKGVSNGITNSDNLIEAKHIYSGVGVTVAYDSESHYIQLKNTAGSVLSSFDADDFIKDGMISGVTLESKSGTTYLVINWNTDAGIDTTELNIGDIFEADNYYTKSQTDTAIESATSGKVDTSTFNTHTASSVHMSATEKTNLDSLATNIATISGITSTKVSNWDNAATSAHSHSNKSALDSITDNVGTMAYQDASSYSSATQVNTALSGKSNTRHTHTKSEITDFPAINDGTFAISGDGVAVVSTSANASANKGLNIKSSTNVTITTGTSEITIAATDTTYTAGSFVAITGSNNSINVTTGTTSSSVARGDHNHDSVYTKITDSKEMEETLAAAITDVNSRAADKEELKALVNDYQDFKLMYENRRERKRFTNKDDFVARLKLAVADQNLERYGLKVGDYYSTTHAYSGKTITYNYVIAGLNTMRGTSTPYRLGIDHVGIIVDTNDTHAWNTAGNTHTSQNKHSTDGIWATGTSAAGYASCDLQYYLETTVLPNVESDLGASNLKGHSKLYSNAVNTSGYNRFGSAGGCSSGWDWYTNQKICALSEVQVYGSIVWSSSGYDTGEACRQLDVFRVYNMNEIFEGRYPWLRDVASSSYACGVYDYGYASNSTASYARYVAALILFA